MGNVRIAGAQTFAIEMVRACLPHLTEMLVIDGFPTYWDVASSRSSKATRVSVKMGDRVGYNVLADCELFRDAIRSYIGGTCDIQLSGEHWNFTTEIAGHNLLAKPQWTTRLRLDGDSLEFPVDTKRVLWWTSDDDWQNFDEDNLAELQLESMASHQCDIEDVYMVLETLQADGTWKVERTFREPCNYCDNPSLDELAELQ